MKNNTLFRRPCSYAKISGEINFQPREFPQSGSKAKDRGEKKKDRKFVITMASYALQRYLVWCTKSRLGRQKTVNKWPRKYSTDRCTFEILLFSLKFSLTLTGPSGSRCVSLCFRLLVLRVVFL